MGGNAMSEWRLKDCCLSVSDGDHLPPPKSPYGIPFITISNIDSSNHINFEDTLYVPKDYYDNLDPIRKPQHNDILYSVVGSFGKPVLIKENRPFVFQRHIAILRPNSEIVDSRFLYYIMLSRDFYMQADSVALGAAQRTISLTSLRNMKVNLPDLGVQRRIAEILSRYDSLIENYQRQIKLLEEAAQRLYKEWFIDLHFPGYENTPIIDGIPQGWEKKKLGEIVRIKSGYAFKSKDWQSVGCPVVKIKDISGTFVNNGSLDCVSEEIASKAIQYSLNRGDLVIAMTGATIGKIGIITVNGLYANQRVGKFFLKEKIDLPFVYCFFKQENSLEQIIRISSASSAQPNISGLQLESLKILFNNSIIDKYNTECISFFEQMINYQSQIRNLTEARDRLLPKLMSGEIDIV